jgi:sugar lactone lactonase YvrE
MQIFQATVFLQSQNELGEGPLWVRTTGKLYWLDIFKSSVYACQLASGELESIAVTPAITALGWRASGGFVAATRTGFAFWDERSPTMQMVSNPEASRSRLSFNDGAVDPHGRFWAGTMSNQPDASLYRFDPDHSVHLMETDIILSNGMGWSPDQSTMYFTCSRRKTIYAYDYQPENGSITNRRSLIHTPDEPGVPDGLAVDREGFIWSARCGGWKVTRYDPFGAAEREIHLPVQFPTSCAFGGENLEILFMTSSWSLTPEAERPNQPLAGSLFSVETGVQGMPEPAFMG